jgi:hypothetical protein
MDTENPIGSMGAVSLLVLGLVENNVEHHKGRVGYDKYTDNFASNKSKTFRLGLNQVSLMSFQI